MQEKEEREENEKFICGWLWLTEVTTSVPAQELKLLISNNNEKNLRGLYVTKELILDQSYPKERLHIFTEALELSLGCEDTIPLVCLSLNIW